MSHTTTFTRLKVKHVLSTWSYLLAVVAYCFPRLVPSLLELTECLARLFVGDGTMDLYPFTARQLSQESTTTILDGIQDGSYYCGLFLATKLTILPLPGLDERTEVLIPRVMNVGGSSTA